MKMPIFRSTAAATITVVSVLATCAAAGETVTAEPDALLDYIEATGSQYIDTGVNAETGLKASIDFAWADRDLSGLDWSLLDASTDSNNANKRSRFFMCHLYDKDGTARPFFAYGLKQRRNPAGSVPFVGGQRCEIITDMSSTNSFELTQNGVNTFDAADRETFATNGLVNLHLNLFVFAANNGGRPSWYGQGKLYELKIFMKNATTDEFDLLRHYIPCTKDNRAGLYDKVNGTISFSASSTNFIAGSVTNAVPQPIEVTLFDEHPEWGYKVEGLGAGHDEMALVFTNQNVSSMAWTVPADLTDVQFLVVGGGGTISGYLGGTGGTGAGSGNTIPGDYGNGQDALANQGGGGGGGGRYGNGGKGGSGIVVLRFRVPDVATGYNDPQGNEIQDYGVVDWLSNNGFTQADINALGHDSAATDRLYECWLLNLNFKVQDAGATLCFTDITVSNRVSMTVQLVRKAPLAGRINGTILIYGANDLAAGFDRDPIPDESVEYFTGDPTFNRVTASNDTVTQTAVATMNSSVTAKFFKAEIGIFTPYEPEEPWEPEPEPEPDPEE